MAWRRDRLDALSHPLHRSPARPALEVAMASVLPGLHLAAVEPKEVEALTPVTNIDHLGLGRVERQLQTVQDHPDPPQRFFRLYLRPAQDDGIIGVPNQLTQLATAVLPEPIQLVEHYIRQDTR